MSLNGKKIILGVSGSIAVYKSLILVRRLIKSGAEVKVVMTKAAAAFVTPLSFSTLSKNKVHLELIEGGDWDNHVDLGLWGDVFLVYPATAATLGRAANGICDNFITASYLSSKCPVFWAPAMDRDMWKHKSTQANIECLKKYGDRFINPDHGELASGLIGTGRLAEPDAVIDFLIDYFEQKQALKGYQVLITAGPTQEKIDPVRFISNHSSGKMGISLAKVCADRGAKVSLLLGPTSINTIAHKNIKITNVNSANEMYKACEKEFKNCNVAIMAAAVSDYTPVKISDQKIKKTNPKFSIDLIKTKDIALELGKIKSKDQKLIGFALETHDEENNAIKKMSKKNFDFIVLNSMNDKGAGFKHDTNKVSIIHKNGKINKYKLKSKQLVAVDIVNELMTILSPQ